MIEDTRGYFFDSISRYETKVSDEITIYLVHLLNSFCKELPIDCFGIMYLDTSRIDRIIVLNLGEIVEEGRHEELIEKGGLYTKLATITIK